MTPLRTIEDTVPERTLGWAWAAWSANYLVQPDGDNAGDPFEFTPEQLRIGLRWFALDERGRFVYRRGALRRMKGWGKDPLGAALALFELLGPCRPDGWNAAGEAVGKPHPAPLVQIAAVSVFQTKTTMSILPAMLAPAGYDDYGVEAAFEIIRAANGGRIEAVTSSPRSLEGARPSFVILNETEHWLASNQGHEMHRTVTRNLAKSRDGSRSLELANAPLMGEGSIAEETLLAWEKADGKVAGLMYDSTEAPAVDLEDPDVVRAAVDCARGDSWWIDTERLVAEIMDPATRPTEANRFYLNRCVGIGDEDGWLPPGAWEACAAPGPVPDGAKVCLGFDGSLNRDSTALVVVSIAEKPHIDVVGLWERPASPALAQDWRVPVGEVLDTIRGACRRWKVAEIAADPSRWVGELEGLADEKLPVVEYPQSRQRMVPATERALQAIVNGTVTHSGDRRLARHVANCVVRPDGQLSKVSKHSPRKIDAAVAMVMALDRAASGKPRPRVRLISLAALANEQALVAGPTKRWSVS